MHGFICVIPLKNQVSSIEFTWKKPFDFQGKMTKRRIDNASYQIEQFTSIKFIDEKQWVDNKRFIFVTEGVIVNFDQLMRENNAENHEDLIEKLYQKSDDFFRYFEGNFSGIFYDKRKNTWYAFNNQTNTKRLYYFHNNDFLILATDLFTIVKSLKSLKIPVSMDEQAAYLLIVSRMTLENMTLVNEVKRLRAGEYLKYNEGEIITNFYFHLSDISKNAQSRTTIVKNLHEKFTQSVRMNHELDLKYQHNHLTTLSGGLDSRTEFIYAFGNRYKSQTLLNFSHSGYADQIISKQIASSFDVPLMQFTLDSDSLLKIDDVIAVNDGQVSYDGCFHVFNTLEKLKSENFGSIHTGIMADTVMGSYITNDENRFKNRIYSMKVDLREQHEYIDKLMNFYENNALSMIYNTIFNGESKGFAYFDLTGNTLSPFLNTDFLSYAFSIPDELRKDSYIYIEWLKSYQPKALDFTWESIGCKPTNSKMKRFAAKYRRAVLKRLPINTIWRRNLAPTQFWYDNNELARAAIDQYFYENIERVENPKLKSDLLKLFQESDFNVKANCITVVGAVKLLFG